MKTILRPPRTNGTVVSKLVRVAVYTRKSTDEGLDQAFNSLDAQRQAVEAFVTSQRGEGWQALPERYDDGGYTGANTDRPGFQRLLKDIAAGRVDVIAVYKIDRLSRSLLDFMQLMKLFEQHGVTFVSVTQQFNTTTSAGRFTLNLLASFAEFERETISERTRDKMAATRRRGMWTGGQPVLGYDVREKKLIVNANEAETVRSIFDLFLRLGSILGTVEELARLGILTKQKKPWDRAGLRRFLSNPLFVGRVSYQGQEYAGAQEGIVKEETWKAARHLLNQREPRQRQTVTSKQPALLRGLVRCGTCGALMAPHYSQRENRRFASYVCQRYQKLGASACPGGRINAHELEKAVVDQVRSIGQNPELIAATVKAAEAEAKAREPKLTAERRKLEQEVKKLAADRANLLKAIESGGSGISVLVTRLGEVDEAHRKAQGRVTAIEDELSSLKSQPVDEEDLRRALEAFDPVWDELFPRERARVLQLLIQEVKLYAAEREMEVTFRPGGLSGLGMGKESASE